MALILPVLDENTLALLLHVRRLQIISSTSYGDAAMTHISNNFRQLSAAGIDALQFRYFSLGLGISVIIHAMCIMGLSLVGSQLDVLKLPPKGPVWVDPPPFGWTPVPAIPKGSVAAPPSRGKEGIPIPVPEVPIETTIPTPGEMNPGIGIPGEGGGETTGGEGGSDFPGEPADPRPDEDFILVEKDPVLIRSVIPKYSEIALRAGLEGKVWLKIWVDREGKPREVRLIKSDNDIFNEAAIEAAKQFLFTPAVMNNGAVSVWVSLPFRFKLNVQ